MSIYSLGTYQECNIPILISGMGISIFAGQEMDIPMPEVRMGKLFLVGTTILL